MTETDSANRRVEDGTEVGERGNGQALPGDGDATNYNTAEVGGTVGTGGTGGGVAEDLARVSAENPKNKQPVALSPRLQRTLDELRAHFRYDEGVPSGHANFSSIAGVAIERFAEEILGRDPR